MMPSMMLVDIDQLHTDVQTSPELRRMDMFNRARRAEREVMLNSMSPRFATGKVSTRNSSLDGNALSRFFLGMRNGLGNALISAGNRIQSAA